MAATKDTNEDAKSDDPGIPAHSLDMSQAGRQKDDRRKPGRKANITSISSTPVSAPDQVISEQDRGREMVMFVRNGHAT